MGFIIGCQLKFKEDMKLLFVFKASRSKLEYIKVIILGIFMKEALFLLRFKVLVLIHIMINDTCM